MEQWRNNGYILAALANAFSPPTADSANERCSLRTDKEWLGTGTFPPGCKNIKRISLDQPVANRCFEKVPGVSDEFSDVT